MRTKIVPIDPFEDQNCNKWMEVEGIVGTKLRINNIWWIKGAWIYNFEEVSEAKKKAINKLKKYQPIRRTQFMEVDQ